MKHVWDCRRTFIGLTALILLFILDAMKDEQTAGSMVMIVIAIAGSNAAQQALQGRFSNAISTQLPSSALAPMSPGPGGTGSGPGGLSPSQHPAGSPGIQDGTSSVKC